VSDLYEQRLRGLTSVKIPADQPAPDVDTFSGQTRHMDHSANYWVVDRDSGTVYKRGLLTRDGAEAWARRQNLAYLSQAENEQVGRGDPICAAYLRDHPDMVFVSRLG